MSESISSTGYEQALKQIKAVTAARVKKNAEGEIEEIHILAGGDRNPKQIVRDVESVFAAQFGLEVDHKKISVAQLGEEEEESPSLSGWTRPKLVGVTLRTINASAEVKVELQAGDRTFEGDAQGFASSYNKLRLFVEATAKALNSLALDKCLFAAEDVTIIHLVKHKVALVSITMVSPTGEESLTGSALVKNDDREAVVKATLDAVNRKLRFLANV
ncbi:MAG: hypothetical protein ACYCVD_05185 [Desulfitobacteriaceae bacterium]